MAMISCRECGASISSSAVACPRCGFREIKPKPFKWWLWGPLALLALFLAYGASIPGYERDANAARRVCDELARRGATTPFECDAEYSRAMRQGRAQGRTPESCPEAHPNCSWGK